MKKLRILCDMDSVIAELNPKWYAAANADCGTNIGIPEITDWDTSKFFPCGKKIFSYLALPKFFADLPVIPGAYAALKTLHDAGHEIIAVTACSIPDAKGDKTRWLAERFPFLAGSIIVCDSKVPKDAVKGDVLIDDGPHNIIGYRKAYPKAFIAAFRYPYNGHAMEQANLWGDYTDFEGTWKRITEALLNLGNGKHTYPPDGPDCIACGGFGPIDDDEPCIYTEDQS